MSLESRVLGASAYSQRTPALHRIAEVSRAIAAAEFERADQLDVIDPAHVAWQAVVERLPRLFDA